MIFAEQIHDLPLAGDVPDLLRWRRRGAGGFAFGCFTIEAAALHKVLHRLLKGPFAGVQIHIHTDSRRPVTRQPQDLSLRSRALRIEPGAHQHFFPV